MTSLWQVGPLCAFLEADWLAFWSPHLAAWFCVLSKVTGWAGCCATTGVHEGCRDDDLNGISDLDRSVETASTLMRDSFSMDFSSKFAFDLGP